MESLGVEALTDEDASILGLVVLYPPSNFLSFYKSFSFIHPF
jgi:hypothetical protein